MQFQNIRQKKYAERQWLWTIIREDISLLGVSVAIGVIVSVLGMAMAVFSQKLIDDILPKKDFQRLYFGLILIFLLLIARIALGALRQFLLNRQGRDFNNRLMESFYGHLLFLPKSFFDTRKTGDLIARLNDTNRIQRVISQVVGTFVLDTLILLVSLVFLSTYSWQITIASLIGVLFMLIWVRAYTQAVLIPRLK
ncbi:MAG: ABC transporter transmembrane domain-containing protein [Microscillaceae bacterium]|nr:ABC transporter transmembrane domain-containing protein [Microscillaceae bacterium]